MSRVILFMNAFGSSPLVPPNLRVDVLDLASWVLSSASVIPVAICLGGFQGGGGGGGKNCDMIGKAVVGAEKTASLCCSIGFGSCSGGESLSGVWLLYAGGTGALSLECVGSSPNGVSRTGVVVSEGTRD